MRILVVEDEESFRELLEYNLQQAGFEITALGNANDALIAVEDWQPDLILLDLMLPGLQGLQFLEILRQENNASAVIIISARNAESDIISALEKGADDYISKPFSFELLKAKIHALMRRGKETSHASEKLECSGICLNPASYSVTDDGNLLQLTQKEFKLLRIFIQKPGRVFSRNQLLNIVWGYEADPISRTVDAHVASLRKKLGRKGEYIKTVPKIGYLWNNK